MSSKYSKLPEKTLRMKLEKMDRTMLSMITIDHIVDVLENYNHELASLTAVEAENEIITFKASKKAKEDEEKRIAAEEKARDDEERAKDLSETEELKREYNKIISDSEFVAVKNAFGVFKKDENDVPLFNNINDQFHDHMKNCDNLKYMRAVGTDKPVFDESMEFKFVNANTGNPQSFEGYERVFFTCFRLFVDPLTKQCKYESLWIINSDDDLEKTIIPFDYKYFEWESVPVDERYGFICEFLKLTPDMDENYKSECYFR